MKKLLMTLLITVFAVSFSMAQTWAYDSDFLEIAQPHGVVVAPDGKIWTASYAAQDTVIVGTDTTYYRPLLVYNADGSLDTKILEVVYSDTTIALTKNFRGIGQDENGNILYTHYGEVLQINYATHEGMNWFHPGITASMTDAGATSDGYIYCGHVGGSKPVYILDQNLDLFGYVEDSLKGLQRSLLVSPDGNDVYIGKIYTTVYGVWHYQSDDGFGAESGSFSMIDTFGTVFNDTGAVVNNMWAQCMDWDANGLMWVGTYWDVAETDFSGWYALDPTQGFAVVDTIGHNADMILGNGAMDGDIIGNGSYFAQRGISFTADGKTAYTADFDGGMIKKWTNAAPKATGSAIIPTSELIVGIEEDIRGNRTVVVDFELKQNYPNPFNPSTTIPFSINATKQVTLKVYDITGQLVATLIDSKLSPNTYNYKFDGSNLASGSYIYQLNVDGQLVNKQMLLIK